MSWSLRVLRTKDIAGKLYVAEQTVKNHLHKSFDKLGVADRVALALYALAGKGGPNSQVAPLGVQTAPSP